MRRRAKKARIESPRHQKLFKQLSTALLEAGIETRVEAGRFRGGICVVEGEKEIMFINKRDTLDKQIALIIAELKRLDEEGRGIALPAALRDDLTEWW